jgi:Xaa-Pro dipeptidase
MRNRDDIAFPMVEYERRLAELRKRMDDLGLDAMMVTTPHNICYLSGFDSVGYYYFNALVVPLVGEPFAVPRLLEDSGIQAYTWIEISRPYQDFEDPMDVLHNALEEFNLLDKRIGFEKDCWFFTAVQQERLFAKCTGTEFVDAPRIVEKGRLIKSDYEVEMIRKAARATEAGMRAGISCVEAGTTENDVAAEIQYAMTKAGSEWPAIAPFVASGPRGAIGHATWAGRRIEPGEFVFLEIAGAVRRYHAPMMRTVSVGKADGILLEGEKVVIDAMNAAFETIKAGVPAEEVDAATRRIIAKSSFGAQQASRVGYSVGIGMSPDWGEGQILSMQPKEKRLLQANMTFHLLPWVQIPGKGGIGITETIRVTETGCEIITNFERKLFSK